jgi:hypothetical protein
VLDIPEYLRNHMHLTMGLSCMHLPRDEHQRIFDYCDTPAYCVFDEEDEHHVLFIVAILNTGFAASRPYPGDEQYTPTSAIAKNYPALAHLFSRAEKVGCYHLEFSEWTPVLEHPDFPVYEEGEPLKEPKGCWCCGRSND